MTTQKEGAEELIFMPFFMKLSCRFDTGIMGKFFTEMRDHKKLWANKCPTCGRLSCPPTELCMACGGVKMTSWPDWVEQGDEGVLMNPNVVYVEFIHPLTGEMQPVPWAHGTIKLDGGATLQHYLTPPDPEVLKSGDRYKVVWKEEGRIGWVHDILHFKKVEEGGNND